MILFLRTRNRLDSHMTSIFSRRLRVTIINLFWLHHFLSCLRKLDNAFIFFFEHHHWLFLFACVFVIILNLWLGLQVCIWNSLWLLLLDFCNLFLHLLLLHKQGTFVGHGLVFEQVHLFHYLCIQFILNFSLGFLYL